MSDDAYVRFLEWESFNWPLSFSEITCKNKYYNLPLNTTVEIYRDNEFKLQGKIRGIIENQKDLEYTSEELLEKGQSIKGELMTGYAQFHNSEFSVKSFFINNAKFNFLGQPPNVSYHFQSNITLSSIEETVLSDSNENTLIEFYLTGKTNLMYSNSSGRSKEVKYEKRRGLIEIDEKPSKTLIKMGGFGRDYFMIKTKNFDFVIQHIYEAFIPGWGNGIQIEYSKSYRSIPTTEIREAISEIVSFIFGTHFLKIGETWLDEHNNIIRRIAENPTGDNVISKCSSNAAPPINLNRKWQAAEKCLEQIIPIYLERRNNLNLKDVLWKYWISKELAIGANLPILSSGLESLAEAYINVNSLQKKYSKKEKKEYLDLIYQEIEALQIKLKGYDFAKMVINKLVNPFSIGIGEKIHIFCQALNIDISKGTIEHEALMARNAMTHSVLDINEENILKYLKLTSAYQSLFNRILLKIFSYEGMYIDYSTLGHPEKKINDGLG